MFTTRTLVVALTLVGSALLAGFAKPELHIGVDKYPLNDGVPLSFNEWKSVPSSLVQMDLSPRSADAQQSAANTYDETVMRTYVDGKGSNIMLALAYGRNQRQEQKIHRPELCYVAQGFELQSIKAAAIDLKMGQAEHVTAKRMFVKSRDRQEAVSYWIRTGNIYSDSAVESRLQIFKEGLKGDVPDGILVRASQFVPFGASDAEIEAVYQKQEKFLAQLVAATPPGYREKLAR
jgi:EpsI family protein